MSNPNWYPFVWKPHHTHVSNYNPLQYHDGLTNLTKVPAYAVGSSDVKASPLINPNVLSGVGRLPNVFSNSIQYGWGKGVSSKHELFPPVTGHRTLHDVQNLDFSNYYNYRK